MVMLVVVGGEGAFSFVDGSSSVLQGNEGRNQCGDQAGVHKHPSGKGEKGGSLSRKLKKKRSGRRRKKKRRKGREPLVVDPSMTTPKPTKSDLGIPPIQPD